jgi:hypothetical protein
MKKRSKELKKSLTAGKRTKMSDLVENIHYMYAQTAKRWKAWDIIDNGKEISILKGTPTRTTQETIYDKEQIKSIREFLKGLEEL